MITHPDIEFDYDHNGIQWEMGFKFYGIIGMVHWTDVDFAGEEGWVNHGAEYDVALNLDDTTTQYQETVRKAAFDWAYENGLLDEYL